MAEIKSTIDIIMEKTRRLTPTDEERECFRRRELRQRCAGMAQRYLDGSAVAKELAAPGAGEDDGDRELRRRYLTEELLNRIDLLGDNARLLEGLDQIDPAEGITLRARLKLVDNESAAVRRALMEDARRSLSEQGFSGAVLKPNIEALPRWKEWLSGARENLRRNGNMVSEDNQTRKTR